MQKEKVSVIVPFYNAEKYLTECIQSVLNQSLQELELLLIDDGSEDRSREICEKAGERDKRIRVFCQNHAGVSNARNRGLRESRGDYICFVDADDTIETDFLCKMISLLKDESIGMGICLFKREESLTKTPNTSYDSRTIERRELLNLIAADYEIGGYVCNKIFRSRLIREQNLNFDESIGFLEDKVFTFTYANRISYAALLGEKLYYYRLNQNSACQTRGYYTYRGKLRAIEKILAADKEQMLSPSNVSSMQKSYSSAGIWLSIYMFREGIFDKKALKYQLQCAEKFYPAMARKHKLGYWGIKLFPNLIYWYCKIFGYKGHGKKRI